MKAARRKSPLVRPAIAPDLKLAYTICFWVYSRGCECRERARGQVCETMKKAAEAARRQIGVERE